LYNQTKRIWCYSHSSRRQNTAELEKDLQNLLSRWMQCVKNYQPLIIRQNFRRTQ
jgi:hypothetical protein